jgi:hypothetical protein
MLTPKLRLRQERNVPRVTERQIQESCSEYLALDGWRRIKTDMPQLRGLGVQEKGMADDFYIRYNPGVVGRYAEVMAIEWKRKTGKSMAHQRAWHDLERARGALTLIAGIDFVASIEGFQEWYRASVLCRKVR